MNTINCLAAVLGVSTIASGGILMDQIGLDDGSSIDTSNATGSQNFEEAYDVYDLATLDNFTGAGESVTSVEAVVTGWNGYGDISGITGYTVNLHSSTAAAAADLTGDIGSQWVDPADAIISATWTGVGGDLVLFNVALTAVSGDNYVSVVPDNEFATNGQTAIAMSTLGDGEYYQANPGGGFGMPGNEQAGVGNSAYRVGSGGPADPCSLPLPTLCTEDVDGDQVVAVGDVLSIIAEMGICGDGTFRPAGDVAPLPYGDCCVDVGDLLAVIAAWGNDCLLRGACCSETGVCVDNLTLDECLATAGYYLGDDSQCADGDCDPGACCMDSSSCLDGTSSWYCESVGGMFRGSGTICSEVSCDTDCNATGCQAPDLGGHGAGGIIGATSDTNASAGYRVADNFRPTANGSITQVCWWGLYIDFSSSTDCGVDGPGTGDSFTITYYLDDADSTVPGTEFAGPFEVASSVNATGDVIPSGIGDIVQYEYTANHPPVKVQSGECYWISIVNQTTESCFWLWETAPPGDERSSQDNGGWGASDYDLGFCVNVDTGMDACGAFVGPCCLPNLSCIIVSAGDCADAEGTYGGDNLTCADVNNCDPVPGACCLGETSCLDDQLDVDCIAFGGTFMGEGTLCADVSCEPNPFDQIGAANGGDLAGNITASQIFEAAYSSYDIATLDNFTFDESTTIESIEAVIDGWNGYADINAITNYTISIYSSVAAAGTDLVGDVYSIDIVTPTFPTWTGAGTLVNFQLFVNLPACRRFSTNVFEPVLVNGNVVVTDSKSHITPKSRSLHSREISAPGMVLVTLVSDI